MYKLSASLAAFAALAVPSLARAGDVAMRVQDVPLGPRSPAASVSPMHFNMLGVHWTGTGTVSFRTHRLHGAWTAWGTVDADAAPDGGSGVWHDGNLVWTGPSGGVQFRHSGEVRRLRAYVLWSRVTASARRTLSQAGSPSIVSRSGWNADEKIVRAKPLLVAADKLAIVHHTAGTNSYTKAQAGAIVRGIEVYHVKGNGWNDIGYNYLVDRFGTVYEGRRGGIDKNVVGAHAEGFNTGSIGVALIGNFTAAAPPKAMQDALVKLLAWRLDIAHVDPLSTVVYTSGGNLKFKAGKVVTLRAISGHRDTGPSECPGTDAYRLLPAIAKRVALTGLPKLYAPTVAGALGGSIRFQARLSTTLPWSVTIVDELGDTIARGRGRGNVVDWRWSSASAGNGRFGWTIAAPGALPATGTIGIGSSVPPPKLSLTNLATAPVVLGGDSTATFTLGGAAQVAAVLQDANGRSVATLLGERRSGGSNTLAWSADGVPDGRYRLVVTATVGTKSVTKAVDVTIDRTVSDLIESPPLISPNGDGSDDSAAFSFVLATDAGVRIDVEQAGGTVAATPFEGTLTAGSHTISWDGTSGGAVLPDGQYTAILTVTDALGAVQIPLPLPLTIDSSP